MIGALAILSTAPVIVLAALVLLGILEPAAALLSAAAAVAVLALLVRLHLGDVSKLALYVEELAAGRAATPPRLILPSLLPELPSSIYRLNQSWDRERAEFERRVSSGETVLENQPGPLILLDDARRVVRATLGARELLGTDVSGRDLAALLRDPVVLEATDRVIAGGGEEQVEFAIQFPIARTYSAHIARLREPAADGTAVVLALFDMTGIKRAEQTRVDFVANASHELRTPLSVLVGCIKTLRGTAREDAEAQTRFLAMMESQADRMAQLVEDLLSLSRIELNEHTPPAGSVDLPRLLRQIADSLEFPANARGMRIEVTSDPEVPAILGDAEELTQLFQNLIDNAIKYGRAETPVTIAIAASPDGTTTVAVSDQGDGIAADHLPRLTERFYRVDTARSRELGGTGLGLAIVKHIVTRHRGTLDIESEVGVGSTFTVTFPPAAENARAPAFAGAPATIRQA